MGRSGAWVAITGLLALAVGLAGLPTVSGPVVHERETVTLRFWPLTAGQPDGSDSSHTLEIVDDAGQQLQMDLFWPDAATPSRLLLKARRRG